MHFLSCEISDRVNYVAASLVTAAPVKETSSPRPNWIAGAVVGPIFLLILAIAVLYLSLKKFRKVKKPKEGDGEMAETKVQLHGDDIKPKDPVLLISKEQPTEMPANELVGSELDAV